MALTLGAYPVRATFLDNELTIYGNRGPAVAAVRALGLSMNENDTGSSERFCDIKSRTGEVVGEFIGAEEDVSIRIRLTRSPLARISLAELTSAATDDDRDDQ